MNNLIAFIVFQPGTPKRIELMAKSQTAALWMGAELLDVPIQHLFADCTTFRLRLQELMSEPS